VLQLSLLHWFTAKSIKGLHLFYATSMRRRKAPTVACFCLVGEALAKTTAECIVLLKEDNSRFWDKSVGDYLKKQAEVDAVRGDD
jgi:hypothetical protein